MEYYIKQLDFVTWQIAKFDGGDKPVALYTVTNLKGKWTCNCPAGANKRSCKHFGFVRGWNKLPDALKTSPLQDPIL